MWNNKIRFVVSLAVILLTGFVTTCFVSYYVAHNSLSEQIAESSLPLTSDTIYSEIQRDLLRPIVISSLMAHDTLLQDWVVSGEQDEDAIVRYLTEIKKKYGAVSTFFVSERSRKYYHPSGILKVVDEADIQDKWYFRVRNMRDDYEVNVDVDTADKSSLNIFINYRVYDCTGLYIGATGVGLSVKAVRDRIDKYQHRYGRRVYFSDRAGRITLGSKDYEGPENIRTVSGVSDFADQLLSLPSHSVSYKDNGQTVYLNSRYVPEFGWYLFVEQRVDPANTPIFKILFVNLAISLVITVGILFLANVTVGGYQRKLEAMATTDKLTGAANRQVFDMIFGQALNYSKRRKGSLSVVMFDIDRFKQVNDTYGHLAGDEVLKAIVQTTMGEIRESDMLCRWGGEEFLALLPDCELEQARNVAEKIRCSVETKKCLIGEGQSVRITASFGVAQFMDNDDRDDLIRRVDRALYIAKAKGRNRVELAEVCIVD